MTLAQSISAGSIVLELYPHIRLIHIVAVIASGSLFMLRGVGVQLGAAWAMRAPARYLSVAIDTVLLTAAIMLTTIVRQYPFVNGWLTAKIALLVAYILIGSYALKRGRTRGTRLLCLLAALAIYAFIISIARTHNALGVFA